MFNVLQGNTIIATNNTDNKNIQHTILDFKEGHTNPKITTETLEEFINKGKDYQKVIYIDNNDVDELFNSNIKNLLNKGTICIRVNNINDVKDFPNFVNVY